jgi:hypothetical protein
VDSALYAANKNNLCPVPSAQRRAVTLCEFLIYVINSNYCGYKAVNDELIKFCDCKDLAHPLACCLLNDAACNDSFQLSLGVA